MKGQRRNLLHPVSGLVSLAVLLALLLPACPILQPNPGPPEYSIILLDPREGAAQGVNAHGEVVGQIRVRSDVWRAFLWRPDGNPKLIKLGTLGGKESSAWAINVSTEVVGYSTTYDGPPDSESSAFIWTEETGMVSLGTLGGSESAAWDIDNEGTVVGEARNTKQAYFAFIWNPDTGLKRINGAERDSYAAGINDGGIVVGYRHTDFLYGASPQAQRWFAASTDDRIPNTLGGEGAMAFDVNNHGTVVGQAQRASGDIVAFRWEPGGPMKDLGDLGYYNWSLDSNSFAFRINNTGNIVGGASDENGSRAVLWMDDKLYDLNDYIPPTSGWGVLTLAIDINDRGCIVGTGLRDGPDGPYDAPFLLVPTVIESMTNPEGERVRAGERIHVALSLSAKAPIPLEIDLSLEGLDNAAALENSTLIVPVDQSKAWFNVQTFPTNGTTSGHVVASFGGKTLAMPLTVYVP